MTGSKTNRNPASCGGGVESGVLAADTCREAERVQIDLWRRMSPLEKARAVSEISRAVQELSLAGIRLRHPEASERECMLRLAVLKLGRTLAVQAYPEAASLFGR
jgi:hypothetical protein